MPSLTPTITDDFPPVAFDEWKKAVEAELEGAGFDKKLVTRLQEGITLQPLYTGAQWDASGDPTGFPGTPPYVRGSQALRHGWEIRQSYTHPDPAGANAEILADLEGGTSGVTIRMAGEEGPGVAIGNLADLSATLKNVSPVAISISVDAGANTMAGAALLAAFWRNDNQTAKGSFGADPLGALAREGKVAAHSVQAALNDLGILARWTARHFPRVTSARVSTASYHDAGASVTQDLAFAMATGIAYLRALTDAGLSIDDACRQIEFSFSVGTNFFRAIAKLRAARRLWGRVAEASGASESSRAMRLHVATAGRVMTQRDPWVNILRSTVACFAGAVAGADAITVEPFDARLRQSDANARRLARNTQLILAEESNLAAVMDPAGGCWFLEKLTDELAEEAWRLMQEVEALGGMPEALTSGWVAQAIEASWGERSKNLARRKDPITGVSEFPNLREQSLKCETTERPAKPGSQAGSPDVLRRGATARADELMDILVEAAGAGESFETLRGAIGSGAAVMDPLPVRHLAAAFEALRDASDVALARDGRRPRVALINLGPPAHHTVRASWSTNFFEAGGFEAIQSEPLADDAAANAAFEKTGAAIAVICSSDKLYAERAANTAKTLKEAGARTVVVAGNPGESREAWSAAGVDLYIHIGCDVLGTLTTLMRQEGALA